MQKIADEMKVTYEDILILGESNRRIELFDGEVIMSAMPTVEHQRVATRLSFALTQYVDAKALGLVLGSPVDVVLTRHIVLQPDLSFISNRRMDIIDKKKLNASPDLVVEILAESTEERDRTFKFREYAQHGGKEYWLVSPEKKEVEVYQNSERGFQLVKAFRVNDVMSTPLFPDADFSLKDVFR